MTLVDELSRPARMSFSPNYLSTYVVYGTVGRLALQAHLLNICFWYQNRACRQHTLVLVMQENAMVRIYSFTCFTLNQSLEGWCMLGEGYECAD